MQIIDTLLNNSGPAYTVAGITTSHDNVAHSGTTVVNTRDSRVGT